MRGKRARAERRRKDDPSPDSQRSANSEAAASSPVVILETISCPAALWADLHNLVDHLPAGQAGALAERCRVVRSRAIYQAAADAGVPSDGPVNVEYSSPDWYTALTDALKTAAFAGRP